MKQRGEKIKNKKEDKGKRKKIKEKRKTQQLSKRTNSCNAIFK